MFIIFPIYSNPFIRDNKVLDPDFMIALLKVA